MTPPTEAGTLTPAVIRKYDTQAPTDTRTATFGLGCFWGPDAAFGAVDGVVRTRVGYAGGTKHDPSYEVLGDHTEVVQMDYDPERVTFGDLLDRAFDAHTPLQQSRKRQYQYIVFVESDDQRAQLRSYLDANGYDPNRIETRLESLSEFHLAETYHQKFNLSGARWATDPFASAGYDEAAIRESPAAAKLNAHLGGHEVDVPFLRERDRHAPDSTGD
jgi:peptide-methionine (S)-S-oxide reductase